MLFRCRGGVLQLQFSHWPPAATPTFTYEEITETFLTASPTLMDPHDRRHLFIAPSKVMGVKGDGLYARRPILAGSLVATYAGLLVPDEDALMHANMTAAEREDAHKNLISFDDDVALDIPPGMSNVTVYRASVGHKVRKQNRGALLYSFHLPSVQPRVLPPQR